MPFVPPCCPNTDCVNHFAPDVDFCRRCGSYEAACREGRSQRFSCKKCRRTFSEQTFRQDYRDRRPDTNGKVIEHLISSTGIRQTARMCKLSPSSVLQKLEKYGGHLRRLHDNLTASLPPRRTFVLDEEETFQQLSIRPLTVPLVVEAESWLLVDWAVGPIRRLAKRGSRRRRRQDRDELRNGRRPDTSRRCVAQVLAALQRRVPAGPLTIRSDEKASYKKIVRELFGDRARHETVPGKLARTRHNPLFAINNTIAMSRDNCSRLRRKTWLVTKNPDRLNDHLALFAAYRNYVRRRFNRDEPHQSSAYWLGLLPRALDFCELLRWRQDWGERSLHPMCTSGERRIGKAA